MYKYIVNSSATTKKMFDWYAKRRDKVKSYKMLNKIHKREKKIVEHKNRSKEKHRR